MISDPPSPAAPLLSDEAADSITTLLGHAPEGKADAWNRIYALLYRELHQIARAQLRSRRQVGSPTSLVSSAWLKLADAAVTVENRMHLVALMAHAMRYAILDTIKKNMAGKRGARIEHVTLNEEEIADQVMRAEDVLQLDQALRNLATIDQRLETIVELRYFGGLNDREIGELLNISERTVRREWLSARNYLVSYLGDGG